MAYSYIRYTGNGTQTDFSFAFPYFSTANISVTVNGVAAPFTWVNSSTVKITTAPASGAVIFIQRTTPKDITPVNFVDGSVLLEADLDTLALFSLYAAQESIDEANKAIKLNSSGNWEAQGNRINNVADPVSDQDVATKKWSETGMTAQLSIATNQATAAAGSATAAASSAAASSASASSSAASASTATTKAAEASSSATASAGSATSSAASASTATTKAAEAATSATTATTKASEAASSATTASTAAGSANTSATAAAGSATAASNSASGAAASATTATTKASEASSSATGAASSATTATGAASTATTKATEASGSATAAAGSATSAASSATSASSSASTATTKAAEAVVSASDSAASAVSAASSAASAAALLDNFDDRYLGAKASAPSVDNDGNALQLGALYFDSTTGKMRVYTASGWLDASSASVATLAVFNYTATASQTSFSGADIASQTLTYTVGSLFVTLNGIDLKNGTDYTATTGSSIVLASGAVAGDELRVYAFGSFLVADTYTRAQADTLLAAKQATLTAGSLNSSYLDANSQYIGFKNKLINGNFDVWQRGQSFGATGMTSDRWYAVVVGTTTHACESTIVASGSRYSHKWTTGAASSYGQIYQYLETATVAPLRNRVVTVSALVQCSSGYSGNAAFDIIYSANGDTSAVGGWTAVSGVTQTGQVVSSGFTKITATFTVPSTALGLRVGVVPTITQASGVSLYHDQLQLELGSIATSYDFRLLGTEILHCQRFFEKTYDLDTAPGSITVSGAHGFVSINGSDTYDYGRVRFLVPKRATPSITTYSPTNGATAQARGYSTNSDRNCYVRQASPAGFEITSDNWGATDGMRTHWTANAELA